jgi:hypothetical protein
LDKRIEELKNRIAVKRSKLSEQMGVGSNLTLSSSNQRIMADFNSILIDNHQQQQQQQQQQLAVHQEHTNQSFNPLKSNDTKMTCKSQGDINHQQNNK